MRKALLLKEEFKDSEALDLNRIKQAGADWRQHLYEIGFAVPGFDCQVLQFTIELSVDDSQSIPLDS
jgi:hypothetical protein